MTSRHRIFLSIDWDFWNVPRANPPWHHLTDELGRRAVCVPSSPRAGHGPTYHIAEEHDGAYRAWRSRLRRNDVIVSFDAHHDCGYWDRWPLPSWSDGRGLNIDSGNWLWRIVRATGARAIVVHPTARRATEDLGCGMLAERSADGHAELHRVTFGTWATVELLPGEVAGVFLCRSPACSEFRRDLDFTRLAAQLARRIGPPKVTVGYSPVYENARDPRIPRVW